MRLKFRGRDYCCDARYAESVLILTELGARFVEMRAAGVEHFPRQRGRSFVVVYLFRPVILFCLFLAVTACLPVTSKSPVGSTAGYKTDPQLTGMWSGKSG